MLEVRRGPAFRTECYAAVFDFSAGDGWYIYGTGQRIYTPVFKDGFVRFRPWEN